MHSSTRELAVAAAALDYKHESDLATSLSLPAAAAGFGRAQPVLRHAMPIAVPISSAHPLCHLCWPHACRVTLSIFPGVLAEDVHSAELGSWYPVALLTAFNLADWAGKSVPGVDSLRLR
jgi:phage tail protein X